MAEPESEPRKRTEPPPLEFMKPGEQQAPPPDRPAAWVPAPEDFRRDIPQAGAPWRPAPLPSGGRANLPRIAGLLLLLSAGLGMAAAVYNAVTLPSPADYANYTQSEYVALFQICGVISIWSQGMALIGGVMAFQRMNWKLTVVCAAFSLATIGFAFEASILGVLALILVVTARPYFAT